MTAKCFCYFPTWEILFYYKIKSRLSRLKALAQSTSPGAFLPATLCGSQRFPVSSPALSPSTESVSNSSSPACIKQRNLPSRGDSPLNFLPLFTHFIQLALALSSSTSLYCLYHPPDNMLVLTSGSRGMFLIPPLNLPSTAGSGQETLIYRFL